MNAARPLAVPGEFKRRMVQRYGRWYGDANPHPDPARQQRRREIAGLTNKTRMQAYAARMALPLPRTWAVAEDVTALDVSALPDRVAIKPDNGANADGVILFDGDRELLKGIHVARRDRAKYVRQRMARYANKAAPGRILAEDLVADYDPAYPVPRDFKVYVAGGLPHVIQVVDRNPPGVRHRFYDRDWQAYADFQTSNAPADPVPRPPHFETLMALATRVAQDLGVFLRLDFYIGPAGPVFGEFTTYPNAGNNFTETGNAVLCALMDAYPDAV